MTAPWRAVRIEAARDRDAVIEALFAAGSGGVLEDEDAIVTHFEPGTDVERVVALVRDADATARITVSDTPPVDWSAWRASVGVHELGAITIAPPWLAESLDPRRTVVIDPALAFGTGEHPTTRGMLRLMQRVIRDGDDVADLGAGSAVLAIAAIKLGAARAIAIELDGDAESNAVANIEANGVSGRVTFVAGDARTLLPLVAPVRVILANIVSSVLIELLAPIRDALAVDGRAMLSGMLVEERELMRAAFVADGLTVVDEDVEGDWWSVTVRA